MSKVVEGGQVKVFVNGELLEGVTDVHVVDERTHTEFPLQGHLGNVEVHVRVRLLKTGDI